MRNGDNLDATGRTDTLGAAFAVIFAYSVELTTYVLAVSCQHRQLSYFIHFISLQHQKTERHGRQNA